LSVGRVMVARRVLRSGRQGVERFSSWPGVTEEHD
jgi:hypothetical protein